MKNRLKNTRCYLAGAMDRVKDGGVGWRRKIKEDLSDLSIHWLDPCRKPIDIGTEDDESRRRRRAAKMRGDFQAVRDEMLTIRRVDLRLTDSSDWSILNIDVDIHAAGTYEELYWMNRMKKPVLVHVEQGKKFTPDWLFATLPLEHIFDNWDELKAYVRHIATAEEIDHMRRWYFFDWMGE
jgi:hypothetical protein